MTPAPTPASSSPDAVGSFVSTARRAAIAWKAATATLPEEARRTGRYRQWAALPFCLPPEHAALNLLPEARDIGVERFATAGIPWHDGHGGPSNHLLSSQVQCVNSLAPFVERPDALVAIFSGVLPIEEILPFGAHVGSGAQLSPFDTTDHVVFEWQGLADHLHEWVGTPTRGSRATSADAAIRYRTPLGTTEIALIEWKYTERYPDGTLSTSATSHATRTARYHDLFVAHDGPLVTENLTLDDLFVEPIYQLARLTWLANRIQAAGELGADRVRVVYVAPATNQDLWASPGSAAFASIAARHGGHLGLAWASLLTDPTMFSVLDSATLVGDDSPTSDEYKARYGHLAGANSAADTTASPPTFAIHPVDPTAYLPGSSDPERDADYFGE